ncbi:helix-turn-helix transcriptional regulator [Actinoplanes sp. NPDC024001]|uniref:helix-turn-helix domain-containing protein n=1 Tax=Actinoplanes sp. NPDC024001 TaxID=3154598 RepID=UPI0033ECB80D
MPAVARRRVRLALRSAREATGLSQQDVAGAIGWSLSKLQRIELGEVTISPTDLRAALEKYGVTDENYIASLMEDAWAARRERYWTNPEYREHLPPGLLQLLQFELAATSIREYQTAMVPGHLQTAAAADATIGWFDKSLTDDERRVRRDVRLSRKRDVFEREGAPHYLLLLDESALWRSVGGLQVAADQFESLAEEAALPNVHVRVLPMDAGALMGSSGAFVVLDLSDEPDDAVLYRETYLRDELVQDPAEVGYHRDVFERFWYRALDEDASRALILARVYDLRARIARAACGVDGTPT